MSQLIVHAGDFTFQARFEEQLAPKTCAAFRRAMPFESQAIHVRWSGEGVWMPLGDLDFGVSYENHTSYPAPGQIILYPGGISETEILLAYGGVHFASKMGQLAGNLRGRVKWRKQGTLAISAATAATRPIRIGRAGPGSPSSSW